MSENPNLDLLAMTHGVLSASLEVQNMLETAINLSMGNGFVPLTTESLTAIKALLSVQNKMITGLTEQNQQIADQIHDLVTRLGKMTE